MSDKKIVKKQTKLLAKVLGISKKEACGILADAEKIVTNFHEKNEYSTADIIGVAIDWYKEADHELSSIPSHTPFKRTKEFKIDEVEPKSLKDWGTGIISRELDVSLNNARSLLDASIDEMVKRQIGDSFTHRVNIGTAVEVAINNWEQLSKNVGYWEPSNQYRGNELEF